MVLPPLLPPDLDARCSRHLTWRQLLECGETWQRLASEGRAVHNLPQEPETWAGLLALATHLLDPLQDALGPIQLTYAFAGPALTRHIHGRIAPSLDQHAGSERRRSGQPICPRLGQAVDLQVAGRTADEVAEYIIANLPFDRLYFYGPDRPLHVSYGPQHSRSAWRMVALADGRLMPRGW